MALTKKTVYSKLEYAAQAAVEWGVKHEYQIKELEVSSRARDILCMLLIPSTGEAR